MLYYLRGRSLHNRFGPSVLALCYERGINPVAIPEGQVKDLVERRGVMEWVEEGQRVGEIEAREVIECWRHVKVEDGGRRLRIVKEE